MKTGRGDGNEEENSLGPSTSEMQALFLRVAKLCGLQVDNVQYVICKVESA